MLLVDELRFDGIELLLLEIVAIVLHFVDHFYFGSQLIYVSLVVGGHPFILLQQRRREGTPWLGTVRAGGLVFAGEFGEGQVEHCSILWKIIACV